jgi:serine/threonine protein kinase
MDGLHLVIRVVNHGLIIILSMHAQPENLLLKRKPKPSEDVEVKIIDFGLSKVIASRSLQ